MQADIKIIHLYSQFSTDISTNALTEQLMYHNYPFWRESIMDYAPIVTTALGVVFILQVILIIQVGSLIKRMKGRRPEIPSPRPFKERKKQEGRKTRRQQTVESQAPASSIDKSLRDINLRLKNAERDQERARKKLSSGDTRSFKRKPDKEGHKTAIKRRESGRKKQGPRDKSSFKPREEKKPDTFRSSPPIKKEAPVDLKKQAPIPTSQDVSSPEQSFGRGSKVTVKRRSLDDEKAEQKISGESAGAADETEAQKEQNISFGRRSH